MFPLSDFPVDAKIRKMNETLDGILGPNAKYPHEKRTEPGLELNMKELPVYQCHKTVQALKIRSVGTYADGQGSLIPEDERFNVIGVSKEYMDKHSPKAGGYYVRYENDYESFSPAQAFESGYSLVE